MKRLLTLILVLAAAAAALYYSQRHKQETRVGPEAVLNALAERYATQYGAGDATMQAYVNTVGRKVAGRARRKFDYKFHYVADEGLVNAFALPGGHVFIGKGLVRLMQTEDE
ncbi:MAG: M48 family metalloprotease, partial [Terriglobales bacterium]